MCVNRAFAYTRLKLLACTSMAWTIMEYFFVTMSCSVVHESQCGDGLQLRKMSKSVPLAVISAGDYLGEVEVFNESARCSAAIAQTDCALLVLPKQHLTEAVPQVILDCLFRYSTFKPHLIATPLDRSDSHAI